MDEGRKTEEAKISSSPNIRNPTAAVLYSGVGMFEATNLSVGRGTERPFEMIGAPWIQGDVLARRLNDLKFPGLRFSAVDFTPASDWYAGQACHGVRIKVVDLALVRPVDLFVQYGKKSIIVSDVVRYRRTSTIVSSIATFRSRHRRRH